MQGIAKQGPITHTQLRTMTSTSMMRTTTTQKGLEL